MFGSSCSLNSLLSANGIETKTSSGMQAVVWAREKRWKELADYCMADTILTHRVSSLPRVVLPLTGRPSVACRLARLGDAPGEHHLAFERHEAPEEAPPPQQQQQQVREGDGDAMELVVVEHGCQDA